MKVNLKNYYTIPSLPGIYKIQHVLSKRVYIGKSVDLKNRTRSYLSYEDRFIHRAIKKYGVENFTVEILEIYPNCTNFIRDFLIKREEFWINFYMTTDPKYGYNLSKFGSNGGTKWSPERRAKMPDMSGPNSPCFGIPKTAEQKARISATKKSQNLTGPRSKSFGIKRTAEQVEKMRLRATGVKPTETAIAKLRKNNPAKRSVCKFDLNGFFIEKFISASEAARSVDSDPSHLLKMAKRGRPHKGFLWKLEFPDKNIDKRLKKSYPILQIDIETGDTLKEWRSVSEASIALDINESSIRLTIKGERNHAGNFFWKRKPIDDEVLDEEFVKLGYKKSLTD